MVRFISEADLKNNSVMSDNIDYKMLGKLIDDVQEQRIHPILGTELYTRLKTDVTNNTLAGNYLTLMNDYIQRCMIAYIIADSPMYISVKYLNKGIMTKISETATQVNMTDMKEVIDWWQNRAQWYAERITAYLCENSTLFPEYENGNDAEDDIQPNIQNYFSGMLLDDGDNDFIDRAGIPRFQEPYKKRKW